MSGGPPFQNATPGRANALNTMPGPMHNAYSQATGGPPFPNNSLVKPPYAGPTSVTSLSPVEVYRQQHEVTASVCISVCLGCICGNVGMLVNLFEQH